MVSAFRMAGCVLAGLAAPFAATAADFVLSGTHQYHTDISWVTFTVGAGGSNVSLFTDSHDGGANFDPTLYIWDATDHLIGFGDDIAPLANGFDAQWDSWLSAGSYRVSVVASPNFPRGDTPGEGFSLDGTLPEPLLTWCQPAALDCGAGGLWRLNLSGVESASVTTAVPEPTSALMLLGGLVALAGAARRRSAQVHADA